MAGVGLARRPCAKVSAASRKLKSSGMNGRGMGRMGRRATRSRNAEKPTTATARPRFRANVLKARSMGGKNEEPMRGQPNAITTEKAVRPASISRVAGALAGGEDSNMTVLYSDFAARLRF